MIAVMRKCFAFLSPRTRWRWTGLIPLEVAAAAAEGTGAAAVFWFIRIINDPSRVANLPFASLLSPKLPAGHEQSVVLYFLGLMAVFYLLKNSLLTVTAYVRSKIIGDAHAEMSKRILRTYLSVPYTFHLHRNSAELIRNVNDSVEIAGRTMFAVVALASHVFMILGIVAVLLITAPLVTLVTGIFLAVVLAGGLKLTKRVLVRWGGRVQELRKTILESLQQALGGLKELKVLGRERFFFNVFARRQDSLVRIRFLYATLEVVPRLLTETIFVCGGLFAVFLVIMRGGVSAEGVPLLGLYAYAGFRLLPLTNGILWRMGEVRFGYAAVNQLHEDYVSAAPSVTDDLEAPEQPRAPLREQICLENVSYTYAGAEAAVLHDVNLTIQRGESIGIVGPTGAGKSSLVDVILGILRPSSGRITLDGHDLGERRRGWQSTIGYVPQAVYILDDSLRRNIAFGVPDDEIDESRIQAALRIAQLEAFAASMPAGLHSFLGERGVRLSGGERQRVGIARAFYHRPEVVVLDEGTSALDNTTEAEVLKAIEAHPEKKLLIIVAHRLTTVRGCDRIVFMREGRIAACGSFADLLEHNAEFRRMAMTGDVKEAIA